MSETTATSNFLQVMPKAYKQTSACPSCGAPIYVDAACIKNKKVVALPFPYFTCNCRLNLQPHIVPYVVPVPSPNPFPPVSPVYPWVEPQITWTVKAPTTACPPNTTNVPVVVTPTAQPNTLDWKRFTESGGVTQHPDLTKNIICINAQSPVTMGVTAELR